MHSDLHQQIAKHSFDTPLQIMAEFALVKRTKHDVYPLVSTQVALALAGAAKGRRILITGAGTGIGKVSVTACNLDESSDADCMSRQPQKHSLRRRRRASSSSAAALMP
jgi:purine-nucleoside phosphorylase